MKGYRTLIVAVLITVFGALQGMDWTTLIADEKTAGWIITVIGMIMAMLRMITTTPPGNAK